MQKSSSPEIIIIGAGPGGICAAIQLKQAGFSDFIILEQAPGIGGTWWHNRYPGAECDVQTHLYSFSFAPKADWSRPYAGQAEILEYLEDCVARFELGDHIRLNAPVETMDWHESRSRWQLRTSDGQAFDAAVVISAIGMFNQPAYPAIPGLENFRGNLFHSARWPGDLDLQGQRVAVIGSAASAVQLIPQIAQQVHRLLVFQRTPQWVLPKDDNPFTEAELANFRDQPNAVSQHRQELYAALEVFMTYSNPEILRLSEEAGLANLSLVNDPLTRARLTPTVRFGSRRPLLSNLYYPTFNRDNVELVTEGIESITTDSIITSDSIDRKLDTIVLATGFKTAAYLSAIDVTGRDGKRIGECWRDGARAFLGITTAGFPNLFMLYGPNTNNGSIIEMIEHQVEYIVRMLEQMRSESIVSVDVRESVMNTYNDRLQKDLAKVEVWQDDSGGYYHAANGEIVSQWPHTMSAYAERTRQPDPADYHLTRSQVSS